MFLYLLSYLGGVLTIVSPCILPVLPFVFSRAGGRFLTNGLPLLVGMAAMFMAVAMLAAIGGGWAVQANQAGRWLALALFGLTLLIPALSDRLTQPLVAWGARLSQRSNTAGSEVGASLLVGVATGRRPRHGHRRRGREHRLYQLVHQKGDARERDFVIEFLDPGAQAYAFTFG